MPGEVGRGALTHSRWEFKSHSFWEERLSLSLFFTSSRTFGPAVLPRGSTSVPAVGPRACGSGCSSGRSRDKPRVCGSWRSCRGAVQRTAAPCSRLLIPPAPQQAGGAHFAPLPAPPLQAAGSHTGPVSPGSASDGQTHAFPLSSSEALLLLTRVRPGRGGSHVWACLRTALGWKQGPLPVFCPGPRHKLPGSGLVET